MRYGAVVGDPVAHSLSPILHEAAYIHLGLEWQYRRLRVPAGSLAQVLAAWDGECVGLSVTAPHKHDVAPFLDHVDGLAKATGAINTVVPASGMLVGFNTDVHGIQAAIREADPEASPRRAVVVGAGATAASALAAAVQLGATELSVVARRFDGPRRVGTALPKMGITPAFVPLRQVERVRATLADADLVVSTIPAEAAAALVADVTLKPGAAVLDAVYSGGPGPWLQVAARSGAIFVAGVRMLVHQAIVQIQLMTSATIDVGVLDRALERSGRGA